MKLALSLMFTAVSVTLATHGNTQGLADPTRPADYQSTVVVRDTRATHADWNLSAIRISNTDRTAIINGSIVRAGDTIGQATVIDIQPVQVILRYENRQVVVRLFNNGVMKKQARN